MSYLGFPRIHFAGAFFTNPGNLNNQTANFEKAEDGEPLTIDTGRYNNPKGVAQYFFRACQITQIVGADGQVVAADPLLGAPVETVNPYDQQVDPNGNGYTLAKIADLDPDMQFRSELYGLRLFVGSASGVGFSGACDVPQLRDLFFGRGDAGVVGLQVACGTWHQRLHVEQVFDAKGASAALASLGIRAGSELDVKLSVDMFQTSPLQQFSAGNMYCYGRLVGTIGLVEAGAPKQIVPGRRLYSALSIASLKTSAGVSVAPVLTRQAAEHEAAAPGTSSAAVPFWNNTDARAVTVGGKSRLLVDMGTATPLQAPSNGAYDIGSTLALGYLQGSTFVPFESQGTLRAGKLASVSSQLVDYVALPAAAQYRDSAYLRNAGVVQLDLTDAEAKALGASPLCIQSNGSTVLQENTTGYYVNTEAASCRMQPNEALPSDGQSVTVVAHRFGAPVRAIATGSSSGDGGLVLDLERVVVEYGPDAKTRLAGTTIFTVELAPQPTPGAPGQFQLMMSTGPAQSLATNEYRRPMDSLLCFLKARCKGSAIGENPGTDRAQPYMPFVSLLFWQNQKVVAQPTWRDHIEPILRIYARLYPGMTGLIDIGNEATVKANASSIEARLNLARVDPGFMPVVRDMSPATSAMLSQWLKQQAALSAQGGV